MDPSSCHYSQTFSSRLCRSAEILGHCLAPNEAIVYWLRKCTWNGPHIHSKHIQGVCHASYAVDGDMDPSSCHCSHTCSSRFCRSAEILSHCLAPNEAIVYWLRPQTHMEWSSHPPQTYTRGLPSIICCGWGYGSIIMSLQPHMLVKILQVG
jgi:hypothetical protein